ncbi:hypothetical protein HK405_006051 [Cladochytrium tenue]|nr:hypothetical protein HK405_006051 [Cladochytrium tenue]
MAPQSLSQPQPSPPPPPSTVDDQRPRLIQRQHRQPEAAPPPPPHHRRDQRKTACVHGRRKTQCVACFDSGTGGGSICQHRRRRDACSVCRVERAISQLRTVAAARVAASEVEGADGRSGNDGSRAAATDKVRVANVLPSPPAVTNEAKPSVTPVLASSPPPPPQQQQEQQQQQQQQQQQHQQQQYHQLQQQAAAAMAMTWEEYEQQFCHYYYHLWRHTWPALQYYYGLSPDGMYDTPASVYTVWAPTIPSAASAQTAQTSATRHHAPWTAAAVAVHLAEMGASSSGNID